MGEQCETRSPVSLALGFFHALIATRNGCKTEANAAKRSHAQPLMRGRLTVGFDTLNIEMLVRFQPPQLDKNETQHAFESLWEGSLIVYQVAAGSTPVAIAYSSRIRLLARSAASQAAGRRSKLLCGTRFDRSNKTAW